MKIGIDISQIAYEGTGSGMYTGQLVNALLKIDASNQYVLFASSLRRQNRFKDFNAKVFPIPPTGLDFLWNKLHVLPVEKLIGNIDVFHSSDWTQPPTKAKKITTVHDLIVFKYPESSHPTIIATQKRRLNWVQKECDLVITDSKASKKDIIEILKIPEEKIRVVYLAAGEDYTNYKFDNLEEVKKKYKLDKPYIFAVGTREPRKNQTRLAEVMELLKLKDYDLVIAGKPGWGPDQKVNAKVLGFVPQEDMPALYAGASLFVYPSLYEGFGVPILEAMTVGCPVATSNISSLPEVGGDAAVYFDPIKVNDMADKIKWALENGKKLKEKSLLQAKKFSWEKTAKETLSIYQELHG